MFDLAPQRPDGIPVAPALPVVGALPFLLGNEGLIENLCRLAHHHGRRRGVVAVPLLGRQSLVFVSDATLAEEVLDDRRWEKAIDSLLLGTRRLVGNGLFTADSDDPAWGAAHRVLAPAFSGGNLARFVPALVGVVDDQVARWARCEQPVDVVADMTRVAFDAMARVGFAQQFFTRARVPLHPFLRAFAFAFQELMDEPLRPKVVPAFEWLRARQFDDARRTVFETVDRVIAERLTQARDAWPDDLLTRMLAEADPRTGERLDRENVRFQVLTFLLAGHETTAMLLSCAIHHVARDRSLARRMRAEADLVLAAGPTDMAAVKRLDLTSRVVDETLRLHPPAPFFLRRPRAPTRLGGRHPLGPGDTVAVLLRGLHRDPAIWPDPERFDPDRFLPEAARTRPAHAYRPFGNGKRICTGRSFALLEATLTLAMLVRAFDFEDPGPLRIRATPLPKPHRFLLRVRPRGR